MQRVLALWDFLLGTLSIGAAPVITAYAVSGLAGRIVGDPRGLDGTVGALTVTTVVSAMLGLPLVSIWATLRWRWRHRILPRWILWVEASLGLACGMTFFAYAMVMHIFARIE